MLSEYCLISTHSYKCSQIKQEALKIYKLNIHPVRMPEKSSKAFLMAIK